MKRETKIVKFKKNPTSKKPKLIDWFICDDIRREDSGKLFFVGVYLDDILVPAFPFSMPQLVFFSKWDIKNTQIKKFEFKITNPKGIITGPIKGEMPHSDAEKNKAIIHIVIAPFKIEVSGKYKIEIKSDNISYNIGSFDVLLKSPPGKS